MLEELSKHDYKWRQYALSICNDKLLADDLVQEMYLKLSDKKEKVNSFYVYFTLKHLFFTHIRKQKRLNLVNIEELLNYKLVDSNNTDDRIEINNILNEMTLFEREILLHTHEKSLRACEEEIGIPYQTFNYHKQKGIEKLKELYNGKKRT